MKNVILITVDCLRKDHLGCYGYDKQVSPFLDSIIKNKEGAIFDAFSTGPFTAMSLPGILTAKYPLDKGYYVPLPDKEKSIANILKKNGYKTAGIVSANGFLNSFFQYNYGFDYFQDYLKTQNRSKSKPLKKLIINIFGETSRVYKTALKANYVLNPFINILNILKGKKQVCFQNASKITKDALEWIGENKKYSFFLWVHYMDTHAPYYITDKEYKVREGLKISDRKEVFYMKLKNLIRTPRVMQVLQHLYDTNIKYIDEHIKRLCSQLKDWEIFKDTLIIITADHGDEFMEHGAIGHRAKLYDELISVPLILINCKKEYTMADPVSLRSLPPTILNLVGIDSKKYYAAPGLFSKTNYIIAESALDRFFYSPYEPVRNNKIIACRTKNWKYILNVKTGCEELYNLREDPSEGENVVSAHPKVATDLKQVLNDHQNKQQKKSEKEKIKKLISGIYDNTK